MRIVIKNSALVSSVILAVTSSLCCIVPVLTIVGGIAGAASSFSWLTPLRPYLIGATILSLGFAFYQAYKPVETDSCGCVAKEKSFLQSKTFLWTITVVSGLLLTFPYYSHTFFKPKQQNLIHQNSTNDTTASFHVIGMSCESCEQHVNKILSDETAVSKVSTSYHDSLTTITFDKSKVSLAALMQKVTEKTDYKTEP